MGPPRAPWRARNGRAAPASTALRRIDGLATDLVDAEPLDEVVGPLQIVGVLAVVLEEQLRGFERRRGRFDRGQQIRLPHRLAGGAADDDLPAALLAHEPDVLHRGFRAVARAADGRHLHLVRREELLEAPLELDARARRILRPEPAELGADAGLHHAHTLGVRLPRRHAEVGPDLRQVFLPDAEEIDPLAAGDLDHRHLVLVGDVGNAAQLRRARDAAVNARNDREGAVLLDVRVHAVVDEPRRAVLVVIAAPDHVEHVAERRLADLASHAVAVDRRALPAPT